MTIWKPRFGRGTQHVGSGRPSLGGGRQLLRGRVMASDRSSGLLLALVLLTVAAFSAFGASTASAEFRHPTQSLAFGPDGTTGSSSFTCGEFCTTRVNAIAYQQASDRIYVLADFDGPGEATPPKIHGFSHPSPGTFTPLPGFPVDPPPFSFGRIAVDNSNSPSSGRIYYIDVNNGILNAYEPSGTEVTAGFPLDTTPEGLSFPPFFTDQNAGLVVDGQGHIWVSVQGLKALVEFSPSGEQIRELPLDIFPGQLAVDMATDDLYVEKRQHAADGSKGPYYRYAAASGYTSKNGPIGQPSEWATFDASESHLLVAHWGFSPKFEGSGIPYNERGEALEEIGAGLTGYSGYNSIGIDESTNEVYLGDRTNGKVRVFPAVIVPDVETEDPEGNNKVFGRVELDGGSEVTQCYFEFATTEFFNANKTANTNTYNQKQNCTEATPFAVAKSVSANLSLINETIYHYRLVAENANGKAWGADKIIEPHNVDALTTRPATNITRQEATLNGFFNGNGEDTTYHFEWGEATVSEHSTPVVSLTAPTGPTDVSQGISGLAPATTYRFRVIAENGISESIGQERTFTTNPAIKDIATDPATEVTPTSATLNGSLDPDGYVTQYYFEYGKTTEYGQVAPVPPGATLGTTTPGTTPVSVGVTELEPGATYHFRLAASNATSPTPTFGPDETFTTPQAPSINSFSSQNVTETSAELTAQINPHGYDTTYYFEYGTSLGYGSKAPVPSGLLGPETTPQKVVVPISGLEGVTYHFRVVAVSEWGQVTSENQTFDFNPPRGCPNHTVRQQTGAAYLPDCRAYELVSAGRAGGASLFAGGPMAPLASSPARFAYLGFINVIPGSGEAPNASFNDLYIAKRTPIGWKTRYAGLPGYTGIGYGGARDEPSNSINRIPADLGMNRLLIWDWKGNGLVSGPSLEGSSAPYIYDNEGNELRRLPTNLSDIPGGTNDLTEGGFVGTGKPSPDFSHYVFSTQDVAFAPGGLMEPPGSVYANDIATETVTVVSKVPDGDPETPNTEDIPRDPIAGASDEYIKIPAVSTDGSHILMSTAGPGGTVHLYMAVMTSGGYEHYEISLGDDDVNHGVTFAGMTAGGDKVYFTSKDALTADDTDTNVDLYLWSEETGGVIRVSVGTGGNRGTCAASWIANCDVEVVPTSESPCCFVPNRDVPFARESGDIYFYSPEQLDGARGALGQRNLYVFRNGEVRFVAQLTPAGDVKRINVSPDGAHMAMITKSRLTPYDNDGVRMMYTYDAISRSVLCVSCNPDGTAPTSDVAGSQNGLFMTDDGRAFFSTKDALVARDANGISDVYEYVAGRAQLISPGTGDQEGSGFRPIGLAGVSADGVDAYFATFNTLVPEDENGPYLKFYDARTNGGFVYTKPAAPCEAADECHGPETTAPAPPTISTGANLGTSGNAQAKKRRAKKNHRCMKRKKRRGCAKRGPARGNRGGSNG